MHVSVNLYSYNSTLTALTTATMPQGKQNTKASRDILTYESGRPTYRDTLIKDTPKEDKPPNKGQAESRYIYNNYIHKHSIENYL